MQDDVSSLQLAFVVKHHGVDPGYRVVLQHHITFNTANNVRNHVMLKHTAGTLPTTLPALRIVWYLFM